MSTSPSVARGSEDPEGLPSRSRPLSTSGTMTTLRAPDPLRARPRGRLGETCIQRSRTTPFTSASASMQRACQWTSGNSVATAKRISRGAVGDGLGISAIVGARVGESVLSGPEKVEPMVRGGHKKRGALGAGNDAVPALRLVFVHEGTDERGQPGARVAHLSPSHPITP